MKKILLLTIIMSTLFMCDTNFYAEGEIMEINNPLPMDRMYTDDGQLIRCKVLEIGPWDMDASQGVNVAHGMGADVFSKTIMVFATVHSDGGNGIGFSGQLDPAIGSGFNLWFGTTTATNFFLSTQVGGVYDNVNWDDAVMNRGYIYVWYLE